MSLYKVVVCLHVLAAAVWIGSMVFFALVVVPVMRRAENRAAAPRLLHALGTRFQTLGWAALGILVTTGIANLHFHRITVDDFVERGLWSTSFGRGLAYKLSCMFAAIGAAVIHQILTPKDPEASVGAGHRRLASWSGRLILLFSVGALYFAIALVRGLA